MPYPDTFVLAGDESISQRALVAGALAATPLTIENLNVGPHVMATVAGLRALGVGVALDGTRATVTGGSLHDAALPVDCGDSPETAELLLGLIAGEPIEATLVGNYGTSIEPVAAQLRAFGALVETTNGTLPAAVRGTTAPQTRTFLLVAPTPATYSALLFAARAARVAIAIGGDKGFDDSAERMLAYLDHANARELTIPGDFGDAARYIVETILTTGAGARIEAVNVNPHRAGLLDVLTAMGAPVARENERELCGQPVADLIATYAPLRGITIAGDLLARTRPELNLIARLANAATGETRILGRNLPDPAVPFERLPNGLAFPGIAADTLKVSETTA